MKFRLVLAWGLGLLLAIALGLVVWRLAPIAADDVHLILAAVPLILWGIAALAFGPAGRTRDRHADTPAVSSEDARTLGAALKRRRLSGSVGRYRVPVYLLFGPSGMGKSSLMERSRLDFDAPIAVDGATWWIGSDAIVVEAVADDRFPAVVRALQRFRPAFPLNGVILAVSPADLTLADGFERQAMGEAISAGIAAIEAATRLRPPVYAVLTKLDLAPGFSEFFDCLEPGDRVQPWGFSLPLGFGEAGTAAAALGEIGAGIRQLVDGMRLRLVEWLSRESDPTRGGRIFNFGAQIAALDPIVDSILKPLLPNEIKKRRGAFLRGLYLTSARQDALSIDPLLPALAERYQMPRIGTIPPDLSLGEEDEGYFIEGAWRSIFREAGLAGRARRPWYRKRRWGGAVLAASVAACLVAAFAILPQYEARERSLDDVGKRVAGFGGSFAAADPEATGAILADLGRLQAIEIHPSGGIFPSTPIGEARIPAALAGSYDRALRNSLAPHLRALLEADLVDLDADVPTLIDRQKAATPSPDQAAALDRWLEAEAGRMTDAAARDALLKHGAEAVRTQPDLAVSPDYLDASRRLVAYKKSLP